MSMKNPQACPQAPIRLGPLNQRLDSLPFLTSFRVKAADLHPWLYSAHLHLLFLTSVKRRLACRKEYHLLSGIVNGSLAWTSGFSLQLCSCIPGPSQLASSSLSVLQVATVYDHFRNSATTYSSCSNWHVSPCVTSFSKSTRTTSLTSQD